MSEVKKHKVEEAKNTKIVMERSQKVADERRQTFLQMQFLLQKPFSLIQIDH